MINFTNDNNKEREFLGLKDYPIKSICCKTCSINLVDFQITKSNEDLVEENLNPITTNISIICNECNYKETIKIRGQFYVGAGQENVAIDIIESVDYSDKSSLIILAKLK
jgi:hypothetical protein